MCYWDVWVLGIVIVCFIIASSCVLEAQSSRSSKATSLLVRWPMIGQLKAMIEP